MTLKSPLAIFLFQYLGLGLIFVIGLWYAFKQGDLSFSHARGRRNFVVLVGGMVIYLVVHGFFQFVAVRF
jgi:hypothetical protein